MVTVMAEATGLEPAASAVCKLIMESIHRIHDCDGNGCLMDVEPNILFVVHEGAPLVGDDACALITYSNRGALL